MHILRRYKASQKTRNHEDSPQLPLRPRALTKQSSKHRLYFGISVFILLTGLVIAGMCPGTLILLSSSRKRVISPDSDRYYYLNENLHTECDFETSDPLVYAFLINRRAAQNLTYAGARALDIAWDIFIGQAGRMLHGWIYYKYVLMPNLSRVMEDRAVPISAYIDLVFNEPSLGGFTTLISTWRQFKGPRAVASALFGIFAIGYVLAFAPIWNAASGYLNPSSAAWQLPDGTLLDINDPRPLTYCWIHNDTRIDGIVPRVINSPSIDSYLMADLPHRRGGIFGFDPKHFLNGKFFQDVQMASPHFDTNSSISEEHVGFVNIFNYGLIGDMIRRNGSLSGKSLETWLYSTTPLNTSISFDSSFGTRYYPQGYTSEAPVDGYGWLASFEFDPRGDRTTSYNSSLTYNGSVYSLEPPLISFEEACPNPAEDVDYAPTPCLCYNGEPIPYPLRSDDKLKCVSEDGYVWGFSGLFLGIAVTLECLWILGCMITWLDAYKNGRLMKLRRTGGGPVRSAFDLVEATRDYIGPDHTAYSDKELRKAVATRKYVAYKLEDRKWETQVNLTTHKEPVKDM